MSHLSIGKDMKTIMVELEVEVFSASRMKKAQGLITSQFRLRTLALQGFILHGIINSKSMTLKLLACIIESVNIADL